MFSLQKIDDNVLADFQFKIVVVGDGMCGKTSMLLTYAYGVFPASYVPTIFENHKAKGRLEDGRIVEFSLWDTAGQEDYDRLRPLAFADTSLCLICFSVDNPTSLQNVLDKWWPEVVHYCATKTPIVLVALKTDLRTDNSTIDKLKTQGLKPLTEQQGKSVALLLGGVPYAECSALRNEGVNALFDLALSCLVTIRKSKNKSSKHNSSKKNGSGGGKCMIL
ncbi:P-loop containing nucleoside triphosphate hydrolase protein [Dipodascopsis uninucleata]